MARERRPAQAPAPTSRKRARQDDEANEEASAASSSKRSNREPSPGKHVNFKRRLESGPTRSHADHRHQSPVRGALRTAQRAAHHDDGDESAQMQSEGSDDGFFDIAPSSKSSEGDDDLRAAEWSHPEARGRQRKPAARGREQAVERGPWILKWSTKRPEHPEEHIRGAGNSQARSRTPSVSASERPTSRARSWTEPPVAATGQIFPRAAPDDTWVCDEFHKLRSAVKDFADHFPVPKTSGRDVPRQQVLTEFLKASNEQTVRYIGCLALGGQNGEDSWNDLLSDSECRKALVLGIIGRALKESIFSELWFGADEAQRKELSDLEQRSVDLDGFLRTSQRAERCTRFAKYSADQANAISFLKAKAKVVVQLEKLLKPLAALQGNGQVPVSLDMPALATIVSTAADLSRSMRLAGDVVYYWPPTFKDEEFEPARMEGHNLRYMIENIPYEKREMHGRVRAALLPGSEHKSEAIVRVVCFPGLVAYRQGGSDLGDQLLREDEARHVASSRNLPHDVRMVQDRQARHDGITRDSGFRSKVICKAIVHLHWGKQRLLTREAGTSAHLDAVRDHSNKYEEDRRGFKELFDIFSRRGGH